MNKECRHPAVGAVVGTGKHQVDWKGCHLHSGGGAEDERKGMLHSNDREGRSSVRGELDVGMHTCMGCYSQEPELELVMGHKPLQLARARTT